MAKHTFARPAGLIRTRLLLGALFSLGLVVAWSSQDQSQTLLPDFQGPAPWSGKRFLNDSDEFQFVVVSDRTGGHREGIFAKALRKINDLRPEFVVSVGDLIEGGTEDLKQVGREWKEFRHLVDTLQMRFFYVPGNHDIWDPEARKQWIKRFGPTYYHFLYKDVLFLCLNTEDGMPSRIGPDQVAYVKRTLEANSGVRWTLIFLHKPLWDYEEKSGWDEVEDALGGRRHTVFAGHRHRYVSYQRAQNKYYQLATTGGVSSLNGPLHGRFDHVTWVTLTREGPVVAHLKLDGILDGDLPTHSMAKLTDRLGNAYDISIEPISAQSPTQGQTLIHIRNRAEIPLQVRLRWGLHDRLRPTPHTLSRTVDPGSTEVVRVLVEWPQEERLTSQDALPAEVIATYEPKDLPQPVSWRRTFYAASEQMPVIERVAKGSMTLDGRLDDWSSLPFSMARPQQLTGDTSGWQGLQDLQLDFGLVQDGEFLYVGVRVKDDQWIHRGGILSRRWGWRYQDSVVLQLDSQHLDEGKNAAGTSRTAIEKVGPPARVIPPSAIGNAIIDPTQKHIEGVRILGAPSTEGYTLEWAIPHASLDQTRGVPWETLRLNLAVRDVDALTGSGVDLWWRPRWETMESHPESGVFRRSNPKVALNLGAVAR